MDDYIAKPVDEKILFNKIVSLVRKPNSEYTKESSLIKSEVEELIKYIDLTSLSHRTKSNPSLMAEMISLYLEQTPPLILAMKKGLEEQDWTNSRYTYLGFKN